MHGDSSRSTKAKELLVQMKFIAVLSILEKVFQRVNLASKALQDPRLDISGGITTIKHTRERLVALKEQKAGDDIYSDATKTANDVKIPVIHLHLTGVVTMFPSGLNITIFQLDNEHSQKL